MNKVISLTYSSSLTDLFELNSSFAGGVMRIAYAGDNRNGSSIPKDVFDRCAATMRNCPIVCRYDRDADEIGGHDMAAVRDDDGGLRLINLTQPVGCVPESAKYWWETITEDDGAQHEYLCVDVLLWKRQEAYRKIRDNGVTAQSMEITVKDGATVDGVYKINDFEFTAFTLLGNCEPCFEQAALEVFARDEFKKQLDQMMKEVEQTVNTVNTFSKVDDINEEEKGGEAVLNEEMKDVVVTDDVVVEEQIDETPAVNEPNAAPESFDDAEREDEAFALNSNISQELYRVLGDLDRIERPWGEEPRYCFVDFDTEAGMVYAWDGKDWLLYGFAFAIDGDSVHIDEGSKKRMKYVIAPFDEGGEQPSPFAAVVENYSKALAESESLADGLKEKYAALETDNSTMSSELQELRAFKLGVEHEAVFSKFAELNGNEAFETLKQNCGDMDADALEEKCYALRGRFGTPATFALDNKVLKLKVEKNNKHSEPYGGLFAEYGIESN